MKKVSIIGAGQLGSRHLQGLMKGETEMEIWVIDPNPESLNMANERCEQVTPTTPKKVHFTDNIEELPPMLDLVIVASGSKPRAFIVKALLAQSAVQYMVLEKFLFTRLSEYDEIATLLKEKGVTCWVNCGRRMLSGYEQIKPFINPDKPVVMAFMGSQWGMCCNTVHFVDIWMYLAGDSPFKVDMTHVEPRIVDSKRKGYIELYGIERFSSYNGDELTLGALENYTEKPLVKISNDNKEFIVDEAGSVWYHDGESHPYQTRFQSENTGILADEIFTTGSCRLSKYSSSAEYHKPYLQAVMDFVNKVQGTNNDSCPIT